ncbi:MAG: hypothetical protein JNM36_01325 [Chitinophagales bacterium]|nr:hypothetical protein [Chitinophagales bacterium]
MNNNQENKRSMYFSVLGTLNVNKSIWQGFLPFSNAVDRFHIANEQITEQSMLQSTPITGVSEDKKQVREEIEAGLEHLCRKLTAFANVTNNMTLRDKVNYNSTRLSLQRDTLLIDLTQNVIDLADYNLNKLGDYNIDANMLSNLQEKLNEFNDILSSPRQQIINRKGATKQLSSLFKEGDSILKNEMDLLVIEFEKTHPDFVRNYKNARIIIDLRGRRRATKSSAGDNMPIVLKNAPDMEV